MNMMRFYAALAGNGNVEAPFVVARRPGTAPRPLGLTAEQLAGLRNAMCAVVQRGTAAGSGGREVNACGKTGTAQNPHGEDHGWFIGYAPADNPKIVVGSIMEFKLHGSTVAPYVVRVMQRYLAQQDSTLKQARIKMQVLDDSVSGPGMVVPPDSTPR